MGKNNKIHVKHVSMISNVEKILEELETLVQNPTIPTNKSELEEQMLELKKFFDSKNNMSEVFEEYMSNRTGKYIVICRNEKHMQELKKQADRLFRNINPNIKITEISEKMTRNKRKTVAREFNQSDDQTNLKLLFLNSLCKVDYEFSNVDGAILSYSTIGHIQGKINDIIKTVCPNDSTIIQIFDSISAIAIYPIIQKRIYEDENYDVDFIKTNSFSRIQNLRNNIYSKKTLDEFKLKIIQEYKKETREDIKSDTVYKGYNLGSWVGNMRKSDFEGKLVMDEDTRKKFEDEGILGERKRRKQTTDIDKYNLLMKYYKNNPDEKIMQDTFDKDGNPLCEYRNWLQSKVNSNTTDLTGQQIEELRKIGYLNLPLEEQKELGKQYNIKSSLVNLIFNKYGSIEEFARAYKLGNIDTKDKNINKRGIILSASTISAEKKQRYLKLIENIFGSEILEDTSKFILEEDFINAIESLSDREKSIIMKRYFYDAKKRQTTIELGEEMGISRSRVNQLEKRSLEKLSKKLNIYSIDELINTKNLISFKLNHLCQMGDADWKKYKLDIDIEQLKLSQKSTEKLKEKGYKTIADLSGVSQEDLSTIHGFGNKKILEIIKSVNDMESTLLMETREDKIKKLKNELIPTIIMMDSYYRAYDYYINEEDIFYQNGVIPPSIIEKDKLSSLSQKREEKYKKQNKLGDIETEIKVQDEKTDKIKSVLSPTTLEKEKIDE